MKKNYILNAIIVVFLILAGCSQPTQQLNELKEHGVSALTAGDYQLAKEKFNECLKKRANDKEVKELLDKTERLIISSKSYSEALEFISTKNYVSAINKLKLVIPDDQKYNDAQAKLKEITIKAADTFVEEAKSLYKNKQYDIAYRQLNEALVLDATHKEAVKILPIYKKANDDYQAKLAKEEAEKYAPKKIVDKNGKQIWKIYISGETLHFSGKYRGDGNFIVKLSDSNQDLVAVIANEIGDFISDKTVRVPYEGWYYLEVYGSDGSWTYNWE